MLTPGRLIVLGTVALVLGLVPPFSPLCLISSSICLYFGITGLINEAKDQYYGPQDRNKEGPV